MKTRLKAFTLIELIVVIAIIGVLAAILVPSMIGYVKDAKFGTANANAKLVCTNTQSWATKSDANTGMSKDEIKTTADLKKSVAPESVLFNGDETDLANALAMLMGGDDKSGEAYVIINKGNNIYAQWRLDGSDACVGSYPDQSSVKNPATWMQMDTQE